MVADEHHLDLFVVTLEEQIQQDEEALGEILALLTAWLDGVGCFTRFT
jgi:hypothetical protein